MMIFWCKTHLESSCEVWSKSTLVLKIIEITAFFWQIGHISWPFRVQYWRNCHIAVSRCRWSPTITNLVESCWFKSKSMKLSKDNQNHGDWKFLLGETKIWIVIWLGGFTHFNSSWLCKTFTLEIFSTKVWKLREVHN